MFAESVSSTVSIWASVNSWFTPTVLFVVLNIMIGTIAIASNLGNHQNKPNQNQPSDQAGEQPQHFAGSPSFLQRIKSINPYAYRSEEPATLFDKAPGIDTHYAYEHPQLVRSPSVLQRLKSFNFYGNKSEEREREREPEQAPKSEEQQPAQTRKSSAPAVQVVPEEKEQTANEQERNGEEVEPTLDEVFNKLHGDHFSRTKSDTKPTGGEFPTKLPVKMKKSASSKSAFSHFKEEEIVETRRPTTVREGKEKPTEIDNEVDAKADDFINRFKHQLKLQRLDSILKYKEMVGRTAEK